MAGKLKVMQVGVYPPPIGGVAIHIQRLIAGCRDSGIECTVVDVSRRLKKVAGVLNIIRITDWPRILFSRQEIVHIHTTDVHWKIPAVFFCLARLKGAPVVLSYHSLRDTFEFSSIGRRVMRRILKSTSRIIAISLEIKNKLVSLGAGSDNISVIPAFLPPVIKGEEIDAVPADVWTFMESHRPVIAANAYDIIKYQGEDLYGIDLCIELCAELKNSYPETGLVFCLANNSDHAYFNVLRRRVAEKRLEGCFFFQTRPCQFYPVLMKSDIFVRPTNTDGDALSLREALFFKVPSVASDAAPRPEGTVVFKNRDTGDFLERVKEIWENYTDFKKKAEAVTAPDVMGEILAIYRSLR